MQFFMFHTGLFHTEMEKHRSSLKPILVYLTYIYASIVLEEPAHHVYKIL